MSYVGNKPAQTTIPADDAVTTAMLKDDAVTSAKIAGTTIVNADINASAGIANSKMATDTTNATNLASGTVPTARLGSGSASSSTFLRGDQTYAAVDTTGIVANQDDIALLAFKTQANGSLARYNLVDQSVDSFEDASGVDASASTAEYRDSTSKYYSGSVGGIDTMTDLMLHMDGADDGTTFTDSSTNGLTVTANGNAHTDTTVKKFGTASAEFDGSGDYLSIADNALFYILFDNFSFDCWIRFKSLPSSGNAATVWSQNHSNHSGMYFQLHNNGGTYEWRWKIYSQSDVNFIAIEASDTVVIDTWYHVACICNGWHKAVYRDGVLKGEEYNSSVDEWMEDYDRAFEIGRWSSSAADSSYLDGYIDEFRFSRGMNNDITDRTSDVTVTFAVGTWEDSSAGNGPETLVNGVETYDDAGGGWMPSITVDSADYLRFDFGSGKIYKGATYVDRQSSASDGNWKWQGSNDALSWTDIGDSSDPYQLGFNSSTTIIRWNAGTALRANTTSYRYYQLTGVSGSTNTSGRRLGFYFSEDNGGARYGAAFTPNTAEYGGSVDMTLVSTSTTAEAAPTTGDLVITYTDAVGTATVNTDIKAYISRNGSAYSSAVTLASQGTTGGHTILTANGVDLSGITTGTSMRWKIETLNQSASKETRIHAVSLGWS